MGAVGGHHTRILYIKKRKENLSKVESMSYQSLQLIIFTQCRACEYMKRNKIEVKKIDALI